MMRDLAKKTRLPRWIQSNIIPKKDESEIWNVDFPFVWKEEKNL